MWKGLLVSILLLTILLMPVPVLAATSADIVVTVSGWICEAPGGFTLTYISDYEVGISWLKGRDADNTMIRAAYGRMPESRDDGYLVYYGDEEYCSDTAVSLDETATPIYYRAWSQNTNGVWEENGAWAFIEGIGVTIIAFIILALGIAGVAMWKRHILLYAGGFLGCLLIALHLAETSWVFGLPIGLMSGYMLWEFVLWWF